MKVNVDAILEISYQIEVDVPYGEEDRLFEELSCTPCMGDILDVEMFLSGKGLHYRTAECGKNFRIETWR